MSQLNWPIIHRHRSQDALDHAASLEEDFEALDACVKLSISKHHRLPSSLRRDVFQGILNAFSDHDYPYEISEADEDLIGGLLLKHITTEAAELARDRIPLRQYRELRKSYHDLVAKLNVDGGQLRSGTMSRGNQCGANSFMEPNPSETLREIRDSVGRGSEAIIPATISNEDNTPGRAALEDCFRDKGQDSTQTAVVVDRPKKNGRTKKKRDGVGRAKGRLEASATEDHGGFVEIRSAQPRVEEVDVYKCGAYNEAETDDQDTREDLVKMFKDSEAQCERIYLQLQDFESEQLEEPTMWNAADDLMEIGDNVEQHVTNENNADADLVKGDTLVNEASNEPQQSDNESQRDSNEQFQHAREVTQEVADSDASFLITFNIEHQAAVNLLNDMGSDGILHKLFSSLETVKSSGTDVPDSIHLTNAMLLDNGNVAVHAHAESKEDNERLGRIRGWDLEFEKSIYTSGESYAVETPRIVVDSLNMQTRKNKAMAIKEILEENLRFVVSLRDVVDIRNIRWCKEYKKESSLIIEFRTAEQANAILDSGLFVRGKLHNCQSVDQKLRRCARCQAFGHWERSCSSALRCGKCALQHATSDCTSSTRLCANCNGPHLAKAVTCPAREAHKRRLRYTKCPSSIGRTKREGSAPETQELTVVPNLPPPSLMPITQHNEGEIKVEKDESLPNIGPVREHHRARAEVPTHTPMPANPQHQPFAMAEGSERTHEMGFTQHRFPDLTIIQRQIADLRTAVERLSAPQHQHSRGTKREANEMLVGQPSFHSRKQPRRATQSRFNCPTRNRSHLPAHWDTSPYAAPLPGQRMPRQFFIRSI